MVSRKKKMSEFQSLLIAAILKPLCGRMKVMMNRSVSDGSPRLLFDYVLKDMNIQIGKPQYHAMMAIQSALKFLELSR